MQAKRWVLAKRPQSIVTRDNLRLEEIDLPEPGDGEILIETLYLRAAPPQLLQMSTGGIGPALPLDSPVMGAGIGRVVKSNHDGFAVGDIVTGGFPWQDRVVSNGATNTPVNKAMTIDGVPPTAEMHVIGAPGLTAWFGMTEYARPNVGDTLVVSTAAGSVGAVVCQLGRLQGCRVIGITGNGAKRDWLLNEAKVDAAIDYSSEDVAARLDEECPRGIDIYFDNVGGDTLNQALARIAMGARVVLCGASSQYSHAEAFEGPSNYFNLVYKQAEMYGFYVHNFAARFPEAKRRLADLVKSGDLKYAEDIVDGFDNAPDALERVLRSENLGTQIVRVSG